MSTPLPSRSTGFYAPELDGLRTIAVIGVMFAHFSSTVPQYFEPGAPGVRLFFVLSGFLITQVLWRARDRCEAAQTSRRGALRQFCIRRVFRLWPLYFASLALGYAVKVDGSETSFAWHAGFATNHYVFHHQHWPGLLSHYWTLAVEQQFYIVWPFVMLWAPGRWLRPILIAMLIAGPLGRALPIALGVSGPDYAHVLLPGCLDFFAIGAAIAWGWRSGVLVQLGSRHSWRALLAVLAGWLIFGAVLLTEHRLPRYWTTLDGMVQGLGFGALLVYLLRFSDGWLAATCRWAPLVYLGKISYGLYILHNFAHRFGPSILRRITGENYFQNQWAHVGYYIALTVLASIVSFHAFEEPLRRLGQRLAARFDAPPAGPGHGTTAAPSRVGTA